VPYLEKPGKAAPRIWLSSEMSGIITAKAEALAEG
jgi:hypothetical protein